MTRLEFANRDQALNLDAAIWLDNIRFNIGVSRVPEAGDTGTLFAVSGLRRFLRGLAD